MYEDDPALQAAIEKGMSYKVINWVVHAALPDISSIIISALNTVMQVGEGESWVQNLLKIATEAGKYADKNPDWRAVTKNVIRTLPPRAGDVPDMVAFVQVWGGMPTGVFIKELSALLHQHMPSNRVVSGTFLKQLAELKFSAKAMPAHMVNAILFVHASADECVQDHFARFITKGDLQTIMSDKKREVAIEADGVLMRAKSLAKDVEDIVGQEVAFGMVGKLMKDIVVGLAEKDKSKDKANAEPFNLEECASRFTTKLCEAAGKCPVLPDKPSSIVDRAKNFVDYTAEGNAAGIGRTTVLNNGFRVGDHIKKKKDGSTNETQLKLKSISDSGTVTVEQKDGEGTLHTFTVDMDEFFHTYKTSQEKIYLSESSINKSTDYFNDDAHRAAAMAALMCLAKSARLPDGGVRVMQKPTGCVFATTAFAKGALLLVPMARFSNMRSKKTGEEVPRRSAEVTFDVDGARDIVINPFPSSEDTCTVPFWHVRGTLEKKEANCKVVDKVVKYRMPSMDTKHTMSLINITFKCIENTRKIGAGDEVLIFRAAEAKAERAPTETLPRTEGLDAKRQRVE